MVSREREFVAGSRPEKKKKLKTKTKPEITGLTSACCISSQDLGRERVAGTRHPQKAQKEAQKGLVTFRKVTHMAGGTTMIRCEEGRATC